MRTRTLLASVGIAGLLVVGIDAVAYAATGQPLVLGHVNSANKPTIVSNTGTGPVLRLRASGARQPALSVNTTAKIHNLNADRVDGKNAADLLQQFNDAQVLNVSSTGGTGIVVYNLPPHGAGTYQINYTANFVPQGTPTAPVQFACSLADNAGNIVSQDSMDSTHTSGFYVGVNGSATLQVTRTDQLEAFCGAYGANWTYGTRPLQVTFTRLDRYAGGTIASVARDHSTSGIIEGR